jgi:hypothetical protein
MKTSRKTTEATIRRGHNWPTKAQLVVVVVVVVMTKTTTTMMMMMMMTVMMMKYAKSFF